MVMTLTLLMATLGLVVDLGWSYYLKQSAQTAADAAALAAAAYASASGQPACGAATSCSDTATNCPNPPTAPGTDLDVGCLYAQSNGFVNNGTTQFVKMSANTDAPPGVSNNSPSYWVKAQVSAKPFTLFGSFGGFTSLTINAASIAAVDYYTAGACIYVLDPSASAAFLASGASTTTATCGIFVHSTSPTGFKTTGSASVTASQILINASAASIGGSTSVSPTPTFNAGSSATSDPLLLSVPTFTDDTCDSDHTNVSVGSTTTRNIDAGTYCGGITIGNSANVTFTGGTYIIKDGLSIGGASTVTFDAGTYTLNGSKSNYALSFGNSAAITGTGVTFFITGQYSHTIGAVESTGATTVHLSAPGSGSYAGMLFVQDRNLSYSTVNSFANSATSVLQGTLYFPTTPVSYSGASATGSYTAMVAKTISFTGSANFKNDPTGQYTGLATTVRGLIQ
jgi:hypothetical protein